MRTIWYWPHHSVLIFALCWLLAINSELSKAADADSSEQPNSQNATDISKDSLPFNVNLEELAKTNNADESFWLDVGEQKTLVLKYRARGNIFRGNVILLHAQGEYAAHPRIMNPLASQLKQLGWQVFAPNLPLEDFPSEKNAKGETIDIIDGATPDESSEPQLLDTSPKSPTDSTGDDVAASASSDTGISQNIAHKHYFDSRKTYQNFVETLLEQLSNNLQPSSKQVLLIANQNSAFWLLQPIKSNTTISHLVLLEPQIPKILDFDLESAFSGQTLPLFLFTEKVESSSEFLVAFDRQLWRSPTIRFSRGIFSNHGVQIEDLQIAKLITGWMSTFKKIN